MNDAEIVFAECPACLANTRVDASCAYCGEPMTSLINGPGAPLVSITEGRMQRVEEILKETPPANGVVKEVQGNQVAYNTGAVRSAEVEGTRYDLISPIALRRLAETCHEGAVKYSDYNWEKGMPISDLLSHAIAHIYEYLSGDRSEDHLAHAMWNCGAACHSEELWPELNKGLRPEKKNHESTQRPSPPQQTGT